jgi:hypothetical protein
MLYLPTRRIASYGTTILHEGIHKADVAVTAWVPIPNASDSYPVLAHRLLGTSFSRFSQFQTKLQDNTWMLRRTIPSESIKIHR